MFHMSQESRDFLEKNCPELLQISDLREFLVELNDFIVVEGLDENYNPTAFGREAQAVYDEIYMCNE